MNQWIQSLRSDIELVTRKLGDARIPENKALTEGIG